jgi:prevent-host-death family protein
MLTVNIHQAKTHLSQLVEKAAHGTPFVIAKSGNPLVKVIALEAPTSSEMQRIGFMQGEISVPNDFDRMGREEIEHLFNGGL